MSNELTREVCNTLRNRLRQAEENLQQALATTSDSHPVVEPARDLLAIHTEIRDLLLANFAPSADETGPEAEPEVESAALDIEQEAHTLKPEFKDVVKALFMWKDDPVERVQNGAQ